MGVTCALGQDHVPLDCVPHIYSSQVAPGGLGKCLLQHRDHRPPPQGMPCPALPHSSSLTQGGRAATPGGPPLVVLWRFTECALLQVPQSSARIHAMGPGMPSLYHLAWGQTPHHGPPSWGFSGWHHQPVPGAGLSHRTRGGPPWTENNNTSGLLRCVPSTIHSAQAFSPGSGLLQLHPALGLLTCAVHAWTTFPTPAAIMAVVWGTGRPYPPAGLTGQALRSRSDSMGKGRKALLVVLQGREQASSESVTTGILYPTMPNMEDPGEPSRPK